MTLCDNFYIIRQHTLLCCEKPALLPQLCPMLPSNPKGTSADSATLAVQCVHVLAGDDCAYLMLSRLTYLSRAVTCVHNRRTCLWLCLLFVVATWFQGCCLCSRCKETSLAETCTYAILPCCCDCFLGTTVLLHLELCWDYS